MASFTYYPPASGARTVDQEQLRHTYFARLAPDGRHLVPGMLHQGKKPAKGRWLDVANVTRDLPERYFVQHTDFHTLVPGSLIQADRFPRGKWKEVKKQGIGFHRALFTDGGYEALNITDPTIFADPADFNTDKVIPVLEHVYPGVDFEENPLDYQLYYFQGSFEELMADVSQMTLYGSDTQLRLNIVMEEIGYVSRFSTSMLSNAEFSVQAEAPEGFFCIILGILNDQDEVVDYVVLEDILYMTVGSAE